MIAFGDVVSDYVIHNSDTVLEDWHFSEMGNILPGPSALESGRRIIKVSISLSLTPQFVNLGPKSVSRPSCCATRSNEM